MIRAWDKGAGIILLNFEDYLRSWYEYLYSGKEQENSPPKPFYTKVDDFTIDKAKINI